jgi:DNA-binding transcriptional regulator YiaG
MSMEQWKPIHSWEGVYEVSDCGRVRSVVRTVRFSDGRVREFPSRVRATYTDDFGYLKVTLKRADRNERTHVHVLVALAWHGPRPDGLQVCHGDGNHLNNVRENLRYDTPAGNGKDTTKHGRRNPRRKLTDEQVVAIRAARGTMSQDHLAGLYNTSKTHVCNIQRGNRRKD